MKGKAQSLLLVSGALWLFAIGLGLHLLMNYENTPGIPGAPPAMWPADSRIQRTPGRATLVMLAHPHCPCTRASIEELAQLMARCQGLLTTHVLFLQPKGFSEDWTQTDLYRSAAMIPGVQVACDEGGDEARRFGATTSGQTLLYRADGLLLFEGGITSSRGHVGDNAGRNAIVSLLTKGTADRTETFAFGCGLFGQQPENAGAQP
jgi:hypothetical protein